MAFPENFNQYYQACLKKKVKIGEMYVTKRLTGVKFIINFPTKIHWKEKSKLEYIEKGLKDLKRVIKDFGITSVAIPPLGCGLGGLKWSEVKQLIIEELKDLKNVRIHVFEPVGSPEPGKIRIGTEKPKMTRGRALLIRLLKQYLIPGYHLTQLEIQKLMYFLQESGENLRLKYEKRRYGPYAPNLEHVLQKIEGHFISGYGDRTIRSSIKILQKGTTEAEEFLKLNPGSQKNIGRVIELIKGFETPYGLELLSTVHWTVTHECKRDDKEIIDFIHNWSRRKEDLFQPIHIKKTLNHLKEKKWVVN
jgi:O-acetyl-ADP-ribose deacetylase (regulator of RNase III)